MTKKDWLCNRCEVGVLDPDKKVRSANGLEFGVVCSECGQWNPTISFTSDLDCIPPDDITLVAGGIPKVELGPPDTGIAFLQPGNFSLNFIQDGVEIGSLIWNEDEKVFRFEGQLDGSTEIFFEVVKQKFKEWHKEKNMASDNNVIPLHPIKPDPTSGDLDNITGKYILVDRVPVACPELLKWGMWMEEGDRHVAETMVEGVRVSTVFLGLDHSYSFGNKDVTPILFETMIFGGEHDQRYQERCCTWAEAEEMHAKAVEVAEKGKKVPTSEWAHRISMKRFRKFFKRK